MKYLFSIIIASAFLANSLQAQTRNKTRLNKSYPIQKTENEWKKILNPVSFQVMVKGGTEAPFRNPYHDNHESGIYVSASTGEPREIIKKNSCLLYS